MGFFFVCFLKISKMELCKSPDSWTKEKQKKQQKKDILWQTMHYIFSVWKNKLKRGNQKEYTFQPNRHRHWLREIKIGGKNFATGEYISERLFKVYNMMIHWLILNFKVSLNLKSEGVNLFIYTADIQHKMLLVCFILKVLGYHWGNL